MPDTPPTIIRLPESASPLFSLGHVVATPGAISTMEKHGIDAASLLTRHVTGDWGDLDEEDKQENDRALRIGGRLFSAYGEADTESRIWLITAAVCDDGRRLATTFVLPEEY